MLLNHKDLLQVVRTSWEKSYEVNGLYMLVAKLKALKTFLRTWNIEVFGHLRHNISQVEDNVHKTEFVYESDPSMTNRVAYQYARAIYVSHF